MSTLEKNLKILAKRYPHYAEIIEKTPITGRYSVSSTGSGVPNVTDNRRGAFLYSNIDPLRGASFEIDQKRIRLPHFTIFLGFGLGYHISSFLQKFNAVECLILFEQDFEIIKTAFSIIDFERILKFPRLILCLGQHPTNYITPCFNALQMGESKMFCKALNVIELLGAVSNATEYYAACIQALKASVKNMLAYYGNAPDDSLIGIKNTFYNIKTIVENPGIKELKGAFKGKPGIVVATGPSLEKNIDLLSQVKDRAVIAAVDASIKPMLNHGFKPHFVTSLERVSISKRFFEDIPEEALEGIYLSACPVITDDTYAAFKGKKIIFYRPFATFEWIGIDKGGADTGPSSGNMAFALLNYLGCDPIIIIGQDLAFSGAKTHFHEHVLGGHQERFLLKENERILPGNYEPTVISSAVFELFLHFYEKQISDYQGKAVNATEGGARILGTEIDTFQNAIDKYLKDALGVDALIAKKLKTPSAETVKRELVQVGKRVVHGIEFCENTIHKLKEGAEAASEALVLYAADTSKVKELAEALKKVESTYKAFADRNFYLILMHYVQAYLINMVVQINSIKAAEDPSHEFYIKLLSLNSELFITLMNLIEVMKRELGKMKEIVES